MNQPNNEKFSFEVLNNPLGVYFESISPIRLFNNEWNIVFHMNLTTIQEEFKTIQQTVQQLDDICNVLETKYNREDTEHNSHHFSRECGSTLSQIKLMMSTIEDFNVDWFFGNEKPRFKRGAFNVVGSILNALFGTLSQEDAEQYLGRFKDMERDNEDTKIIIAQQMTLIKSTAQILNKMDEENSALHRQTQEQFDTVNQTLNKLRYDYENLWINMEAQFQMDNLLMFISLKLTSFHHKQQEFLKALSLGSKQDSQTPILLPPAMLIRELNNIKYHVAERELLLPLPVNKETIPIYYKIASTRSRILDNQFLISMSIPLVGLLDYELIKLTSFPQKTPNGLYQFILPEHEYVAIDTFRENYISFSNQELENCHDLREYSSQPEIICIQSSPTIRITSNRDDCGITLLTQNQQTANCNIRVSNISSEVFLKLRQPNSWLYVFPQQRIIFIRCDNLSRNKHSKAQEYSKSNKTAKSKQTIF